ncbi:hypothetical protein [Xanthobacter sp.]|nr:hypothetical protein [Xanthobacter sp.]
MIVPQPQQPMAARHAPRLKLANPAAATHTQLMENGVDPNFAKSKKQ